MHIFKDPKFDFVRWRWHALILSWVIIIAGVAAIYTRGIPLGIEFSGGTVVIAQFDREPSIEQVRAALDKGMPGGGSQAVVQAYGTPGLREVMIRVPQVGHESGNELTQSSDEVQAALRKANLGHFNVVGTQVVGPVVGQQLTRKGTLAMVLSLVGLLIYIAFRFRFSFAVGAVIATVHDLLVTFAFLAFFHVDLSLNVIAAILTMSGYSTNDTIVIFDRIREDARLLRNLPIKDVMNKAVNQTLNRTVISSGTTLLSAIALYLFGGEVLHGFAFTMIVGVITGTYSSVFIAGTVVTFWKGRGSAAAMVASTAGKGGVSVGAGAAAERPSASRGARSRPQRKRRAS
ncbi:MAG TPA: protein translocase subunit SecF [Vicinamibacterales bacterium]|jgi:preprotein translocase subunit SecF